MRAGCDLRVSDAKPDLRAAGQHGGVASGGPERECVGAHGVGSVPALERGRKGSDSNGSRGRDMSERGFAGGCTDAG